MSLLSDITLKDCSTRLLCSRTLTLLVLMVIHDLMTFVDMNKSWVQEMTFAWFPHASECIDIKPLTLNP